MATALGMTVHDLEGFPVPLDDERKDVLQPPTLPGFAVQVSEFFWN